MSKKLDFGSLAWIKQLQAELNKSESYAEAAKHWEGDIYFIIEARGSTLKKDIYLYLDLWHGQCRDVAVPEEPDAFTPEFTFRGSLKTFKQLIDEGLDPMKAIMTRQLKLQGNLTKIMRHVKAANQLIQCCTLVPTHFPLA